MNVQAFAVSAVHEGSSVCTVHGSGSVTGGQSHAGQGSVPMHVGQVQVGTVGSVGAGEAPESHVHAQSGQLAPTGQLSHAHVQVPPQVLPLPESTGTQAQSQGGQDSPGAQASQVQVQVPPPVPPLGGGGHAQSHGGQSVPCGQNIGQAHAQSPAALPLDA